MSPEEERIKLLTRLGRETVIKRGTYDMDKARPIIQDHPFYKQPEPEAEIVEEIVPEQYEEEYYEEPVVEEPVSEEEAALLAAQIMQNNFKTGMSQADVDAFLNGMI